MKRAALLLLVVACSKKAPPPPAPTVAEAAPAPACDVTVETRTADFAVVQGPRDAGIEDATNLAMPISGHRIAVLKVGATGAESCEGAKPAVNREIEDPSATDDVVVYDEETTPLRRGEDGCEQAGPVAHRWHAVDTRTKKEWVFGGDVTVTVEPKQIVAKKAGCTEIRYSR